MRKAQVIGQALMFVLAGLIFVLILVYGYRAVTNLTERGEQVELLNFKGQLQSAIETVKRDYGAVQRVDLRVPQADLLCFASAQPENTYNFETAYPLLYESWRTGTENVFLLPKQATPILVPDLVVDNEQGWFCLENPGRHVSLRVEGTGKNARVREWTSAQ